MAAAMARIEPAAPALKEPADEPAPAPPVVEPVVSVVAAPETPVTLPPVAPWPLGLAAPPVEVVVPIARALKASKVLAPVAAALIDPTIPCWQWLA